MNRRQRQMGRRNTVYMTSGGSGSRRTAGRPGTTTRPVLARASYYRHGPPSAGRPPAPGGHVADGPRLRSGARAVEILARHRPRRGPAPDLAAVGEHHRRRRGLRAPPVPGGHRRRAPAPGGAGVVRPGISHTDKTGTWRRRILDRRVLRRGIGGVDADEKDTPPVAPAVRVRDVAVDVSGPVDTTAASPFSARENCGVNAWPRCTGFRYSGTRAWGRRG